MNSTRSSNRLPSTMLFKDQPLTSPTQIANGFANHFMSSFQVARDCSTTFNGTSTLDLNNFTIGIGEVFAKLNSLEVNKGAGDDAIPPVFFKSCKFIFARILWCIFNLSLKSGVFPTRWKSSLAVPVFKSGDKMLISNYRPISILNIMAKAYLNLMYCPERYGRHHCLCCVNILPLLA